jgi:hypothetical protein
MQNLLPSTPDEGYTPLSIASRSSYSSTLTACIMLFVKVFNASDKVISVAVKQFKTMQAPIALDRLETGVVPSDSYMVIPKELDMS